MLKPKCQSLSKAKTISSDITGKGNEQAKKNN